MIGKDNYRTLPGAVPQSLWASSSHEDIFVPRPVEIESLEKILWHCTWNQRRPFEWLETGYLFIPILKFWILFYGLTDEVDLLIDIFEEAIWCVFGNIVADFHAVDVDARQSLFQQFGYVPQA